MWKANQYQNSNNNHLHPPGWVFWDQMRHQRQMQMHPINLLGSVVGQALSPFLTSSPDMQRKSDQDHRIKLVNASRKHQKKHILKNWSTVQEDLDHFTGQQCDRDVFVGFSPKYTHSLMHFFRETSPVLTKKCCYWVKHVQSPSLHKFTAGMSFCIVKKKKSVENL